MRPLRRHYALAFAVGLVALGAFFVAYGLWEFWEPAAWIFVGLVFVAAGLLVEVGPPRRRS